MRGTGASVYIDIVRILAYNLQPYICPSHRSLLLCLACSETFTLFLIKFMLLYDRNTTSTVTRQMEF